MQVKVKDGSWEVMKPVDDWTRLQVEDMPTAPMRFYTLEGLKQGAYYEVKVTAHNDIGDSVPTEFVFLTAEGRVSDKIVQASATRGHAHPIRELHHLVSVGLIWPLL